MTPLYQSIRLTPASIRQVSRHFRNLSTFAQRDIVLLRQKSNQEAIILTKPLDPASKISTHKGDINHSDIVGKSPRDLVTTSAGFDYRIHSVTLAEYVSLSRRLVTPIYPADANLIVSLLDLHPSPDEDADKIEILEAGTGHGALTLHLSRAIHAANSPKPIPLPEAKASDDVTATENSSEGDANSEAMNAWKASRKAVIHTIDVSPKYSKHAAKIVSGFRHGLYAGNVDFHVGDVSEWIEAEFDRRDPASGEPFLTHAFLDLPATHDHIASVASALKTDGVLIVFNPSITQVMDCVQKVKRQNLPLFLDQTLELGNNGSSGGKPWDLRAVKPRAPKVQPAEVNSEDAQYSASEKSEQQGQSLTRDPTQALAEAKSEDTNWSFVCRPKVGERIVGGGFLGVFRKMGDARQQPGRQSDAESVESSSHPGADSLE